MRSPINISPSNTDSEFYRLTQTGTVILEHSFDAPSEQTGPGIPNYLGPALVAPHRGVVSLEVIYGILE